MKSIKNLSFCWMLIIGLSSCKTSVDVAGVYISKNNLHGYGMSSIHKFIFSPDFTFNYFYIVIGDIEKKSSGTWKYMDKNTIVLNSNIQSNEVALSTEIVPSNNKNPMINVKLIVPGKDEKEYRCSPYIAIIKDKYYVENFLPDRGNYSYEITNHYSNNHEFFFKISKEPSEFIPGRGKIEYYLLETEHKKIALNNGDIVNISVTVPDSLFSYRIFNDETIKFNGNKLIFKDKEDNNKTSKLHIKD